MIRVSFPTASPPARRAAFRGAALVLGLLALGSALGGCKPKVEAPATLGVCYQMSAPAPAQPGAKVQAPFRYTVVAKDVPHIENCMAYLEALRLRFLQLGGSRLTLEGAYNGHFIHARPEGIFTSQEYDGNAYIALVRSADGRLVAPGAAGQ